MMPHTLLKHISYFIIFHLLSCFSPSCLCMSMLVFVNSHVPFSSFGSCSVCIVAYLNAYLKIAPFL